MAAAQKRAVRGAAAYNERWRFKRQEAPVKPRAAYLESTGQLIDPSNKVRFASMIHVMILPIIAHVFIVVPTFFIVGPE